MENESFMMKRKILSLAAATVLALSSFATNVETDRTWYLAGEAMKISVRADNALIAYAELSDANGLAAGVVVGLKGGEGEAVVELPSHLHSGYYVLSVYTRDDSQATQRLVAVVNALHKSKNDEIQWVPSDSCWAATAGTADWGNAQAEFWATKPADVREAEGHIIKARVRNHKNGYAFKASEICPSLSIVGKQIHYFEGKMVDDSTAVFYTYGIHGKQPLVLSALSSTDESLPIEMMSPFVSLLPTDLPHLVFHYKRSEVEARSIAMQRHQRQLAPAKSPSQSGTYADDAAEEVVPLDYDDTVLGTQPYLTYNLDEYRQFLTVREVLIEYVKCVTNKKTNGVPHLFVYSKQFSDDSSWPTLVLIDGMPVYDIERLLNYDARRIHYINIYGGQYTFGNGVYNGILSFVTRSGRLTNYPTEPNAQYLVYEFPE
jgi:hypothetical protein